MNDAIKEVKENKIDTTFNIVGGYVGKYTIGYLNKIYSVEFPVENSLDQNLDVIDQLRDKIIFGIEELAKKEKEKKEKEKK